VENEQNNILSGEDVFLDRFTGFDQFCYKTDRVLKETKRCAIITVTTSAC
jgi:hypothetical protein